MTAITTWTGPCSIGGSAGSDRSLSLSENEAPLLRGFSLPDESLVLAKGIEASILSDGGITLVTERNRVSMMTFEEATFGSSICNGHKQENQSAIDVIGESEKVQRRRWIDFDDG